MGRDATLIVTFDPRSMHPVMLLLWELTELRDRLRIQGLTEHADAIDAMIDRLDRGARSGTLFLPAIDDDDDDDEEEEEADPLTP